MSLKTVCLAALRPLPEVVEGIERAARDHLLGLEGLRQVGLDRVVRHVPTDYIANDRPYGGVVAQADDIGVVLDLQLTSPEAGAQVVASQAWRNFLLAIAPLARPLFSLDSEANVPVPLRAGSVHGGFRRWLLLTRKAPTVEAFREAWFVRHADLVKHLPRLDGYVQNLVNARYNAQGEPVTYTDLPIDGIAEVCYADEAAMVESYASDARLPLRDDGAELNARVSTILVDGKVIR
ncbi:EthD domain-containing protein [Hydrogenophaga sp.]|uniref:EthD domain-containing protein n=1 Tax=Hydrogenophaga sp. TaxID=1904254 RepID=UPI003F6ED640